MRPILIQQFGADPEVFLVDANGQPFSAEGLFGGTKHEPKPMEGLPAGYFIQEDNVAAEYNVPPTADIGEWAKELQRGLSYIRKGAKRHKLKPFLAPDLEFPIEQVLTPHAQELGCDPDFNAWTAKQNPRPRPPERMRTAAGHIHTSWQNPDDEQRLTLVKALDVFMGLPSILATAPNNRRKLYGKAGAHRPKEYGVEYRVLDNFYLASVPLSVKVVETAYTAADYINFNPLGVQQLEKHGEEIQKAINEHDKVLAADLMEYFGAKEF